MLTKFLIGLLVLLAVAILFPPLFLLCRAAARGFGRPDWGRSLSDMMARHISATVRVLSGESLLNEFPNSGAIVLARAGLVTLIVYSIAVFTYEITNPRSIMWTLDSQAFVKAINRTFPWIGAIFAGAYVALYSRFASQFAYVSGLYNQIMQSAAGQVRDGGETEKYQRRVIAMWWASFIEDADELHLSRKPMFAVLIHSLITERPDVLEAFIESVPGADKRLELLLAQVEEVNRKSAEAWKRKTRHLPSPERITALRTMPRPADLPSADPRRRGHHMEE